MQPDGLKDQVLAGRYRIESLLGKGGMGAVYKARDELSGAIVALKVLLPGEHQTRFLPRLMREARLATKLHHENVVRVLDHGRWGEDRQRFYLTMELVEGITLDRFVDTDVPADGADQRMGWPAWCELARQLLAALAHVHARGVLHRDIKPENVLVSRSSDGRLRARLADFGLAAATSDETATDLTRLTQEGSLLGTPAYMAPEQIEGRTHLLGPTVDIYTVGVLLYELCTGRLPFEGSLNQMLFAKLQQEPPRISDLGPELVPNALDDVVHRMMARRPEDRYQLAADAQSALEPLAGPALLDVDGWRGLTGGASMSTRVDAAFAPTIGSSGDGARETLPATVPETDFCGRGDEIADLLHIAERVEAGNGQVVLVKGAMGMGKSALVEKVAVDLNEAGRFQIMRGKRPPAGGVMGCLRAALDDWLGTSGRDAERVREVLESRVRRQNLGLSDVSRVVGLMRPNDVADPPDTQRACAIFVRLLRHVATRRPLLVLLDDLATDAGTAALLELLIFELGVESFPLFVAMPLPSGGDDDALGRALANTASAEGQMRHTVRLEGMSTEELSPWLEHTFGLKPQLAERIVERAGGNPFFARQLASVRAAGSGPRLDATPQSDATDDLPEVLRDLLLAGLREKLGRLDARARVERLLDRAAILGEHIDVELLEAFCEQTSDASSLRYLDDDLDALIDAEILADAGIETVIFAHALLRDAVLSQLSPRKKRRLHRQAVELREAEPEPHDDAAIGMHLAAAGLPARAAEAWTRAHRRALEHGELGQALQWGVRAVELMDPDDARRPPLALEIGRIARAVADFERGQEMLEPLLDATDPDIAVQAGEILAEIHHERADEAAWGAVIERVSDRIDAVGPGGRGAWCRARALWLNFHNDVESARPLAEEGHRLADNPHAYMTATRRLIHACMAQGERDQARTIAQDCVDTVQARWPGHELEARSMRLLVETNYGDPDALADEIRGMRQALREAGRVGRSVSMAFSETTVLIMAGAWNTAHETAQEGLEMAERFGLGMEVLRMQTTMAVCDVALHRPALADERLGERDFPGPPSIRNLFDALVAAGLHDAERARAYLDDVDPLLLPPHRYFGTVLTLLAETLVTAGDSETARQAFEHSRTVFARFGADDSVARCESRLQELQG